MIAIVDYGMGNLRSVQKGFEKVGQRAEITSDPARVAAADKVVLPGVGAFADAMRELGERKLIEPVCDAIDADKPFLGICLGLQLLFTKSYEDGEHEGLGVLTGRVVRFTPRPELKVPHMGWNTLEVLRRPPVLEGVAQGTHVYFVHSYYVVPEDKAVIATQTTYGEPFASMVWRDNVFACQFHPEKSQRDGLQLLRNFASL
jgi:glutamine amidotransferase